jgi:hypothetical protein
MVMDTDKPPVQAAPMGTPSQMPATVVTPRKNPWIIVSVILALICVLLLYQVMSMRTQPGILAPQMPTGTPGISGASPSQPVAVAASPSVSTTGASPTIPSGWERYENTYWGIALYFPKTELTLCHDPSKLKDGARFFAGTYDCDAPGDVMYEIGVVGYEPGKYAPYKIPAKTEKITLDGREITKHTFTYDEQDGPLFGLRESVDYAIPHAQGTLVLQQLGADATIRSRFERILATLTFLK